MEGGGNEEPKTLFSESLAQMPQGRVAYYELLCGLLESLNLSVGISGLIGPRLARVHLSNWFVKPDPGTAHPYRESLHSPHCTNPP
jgi:hypothetical protein